MKRALLLLWLWPSVPACAATGSDFQASLDQIRQRCALGPYMLVAAAGRRARITVEPTVRAAPLSVRQLACIRMELDRIPGARLLEEGRPRN